MKVGDLVRHKYTGRIHIVTSVISREIMTAKLVTLLGFPINRVFNVPRDIEALDESR